MRPSRAAGLACGSWPVKKTSVPSPPLFAPSPARLAQARRVNDGLRRAHPDAKCALRYGDPLQLLIATVLSAQCTDARVNQVTPELFRRYPNAAAFANAPAGELERLIQPTGFFRNKAKAIRAGCMELVAKHGGQVPRTLDELTALQGVGRKTANVVLGNCFGVPGIVVDTHVTRLSQRLGLTRQKAPEKIESDLVRLLPREDWVAFGHRMIEHGRRFCKAPRPACEGCPLEAICPYPDKSTKPKGPARASVGRWK
jgi:endonuclease-3